ncbi:MAG: hypothetical protein HY033_09785 [Ignavibacteriae bacterium]|nr:hypothetical protein [Ignavibacteria bacterium]MBI3365185.1 hypothetical protein [Ignavibacteriota bacterium]
MKITGSIIASFALLFATPTYGQTTLDSARAEMFVSLFDQVSTPIIQVAKAYQNEKKALPADSGTLVNYARTHKDALDMRSYKSFGVRVDTSHQLVFTFSFKPFRMSLAEKEGDSRVTSLVGMVRFTPIGKEPNGAALFITVIDASVILPDSSPRRVKEYSQVTVKVIAPRW